MEPFLLHNHDSSCFSQLSEEKKDAIVKEKLAKKLNLLFTPAPEDVQKQD